MKTEELKTDILAHTFCYEIGRCKVCKHTINWGKQDMSSGWTCRAFPDGIPYSIAHGVNRHDIPYPYDNGIQFMVEPALIEDDAGNPCWLYYDYSGCPNVVANVEDLPAWAKPLNMAVEVSSKTGENKIRIDERVIYDYLKSLADLVGILIPKNTIAITMLEAPHTPPSRLPPSKMAVYLFFHKEKCLKIGKVGTKSSARYTSQHYSSQSANSTLAKSIIKSPGTVGLGTIGSAQVRDWIKNNTDRINIQFSVDFGMPFLTLVESFFQCLFKPAFEGFESQKIKD